METTALYVELILIGLETVAWIVFFAMYLAGTNGIYLLTQSAEKLPTSLLLLGIMYIIGLLIDRAADFLFEPLEKHIKGMCKVKSESIILLWEEADAYFQFIRSKIRILRASILNLPLLTMSLFLNAQRHIPNLSKFVVLIGAVFSFLSCLGYFCTLKNQYKKAGFLEKVQRKKAKR